LSGEPPLIPDTSLNIDDLLTSKPTSLLPPTLENYINITVIAPAEFDHLHYQNESGQLALSVDQYGDIEVTKRQIRDWLYSAEDEAEGAPNQESLIQLRLANGGIIDRNLALMDGDIVYASIIKEKKEYKKN
jgi:hypothetical protein